MDETKRVREKLWRVVQEEAQTEEDWSRSDVEDLINEVVSMERGVVAANVRHAAYLGRSGSEPEPGEY